MKADVLVSEQKMKHLCLFFNLIYPYSPYVQKFAVAALKSLKGARKALKAAGAPQSEKKPFTDIIKPLKAFRKAVKGGGDPCAPIPEPQS